VIFTGVFSIGKFCKSKIAAPELAPGIGMDYAGSYGNTQA
jgi:hypothetical protein